jgi:uncharacterized protein YtpQ (UPF0354 family)
MRRTLLVLLTCALVAACRGGDGSEPTEDPSVARAAVKAAVATALKQAGYEAEPGFGAKVRAQEGLDWVDVILDSAVREYREDPDRRAEIVARVVRETEGRFQEGISSVSFEEARRFLMPVLKPRFQLRKLDEEPAATESVAGLAVVYAVQRENDFTLVSEKDAERWGRPLADLHRIALANLLRQTNREEKLLCEPSGGSELCGWASGDGYDATRMIVPQLREQIEREYDGPAVYAAPIENVFVALPLRLATRKNTERLLRTKVERDFATSKAPVSPELFVERGGKLVVFRA